MEPVPAAAYTIAARHHIPRDQVHPLPPGGAHHVLALGPDLVLRLPRTTTDAEDLRKEATLIPLARRAGVRTPALISATRPGEELPHMLLARAPGTDLNTSHPAPELLTQIGHQLALIHRVPTDDLPHSPAIRPLPTTTPSSTPWNG